ncbi:MAG: class I SAM-dependent methyltransferase [Chloroflexi bacterium]|nr:class I SAM-dependent methyltransferase [Chloroflexota bacterium]
MNVQTAYTSWSATYDSDRNLTRDLDQEVTRQTFANLRFESILEIGCGTGKNTALYRQIAQRVLALDFSEAMIARAKEKVQAGNVTFAVADITKLWPCRDRSADLVACDLVLEHIEHLDPIFAQAFGCLIPGGRFFVCELHPFKQYQGKKAKFQRAEQAIEVPAFVHHVSDFVHAAETNQMALKRLREWWHVEDRNALPRLVSFLFEKPI